MVEPPTALDALARDLEQLRISSGGASYGEIAGRIVERRIARGATPAAAQIARSTVYDVFRPGRRRVNADLVFEIVLAFGADEATARSWWQRSLDARLAETRDAALAVPQPGMLHNPAFIALIVVACVGVNIIGGQFVAAVRLPLYFDMAGTATAAVLLGPWAGVAAAIVYHVLAAWFDGDFAGLWFSLVNITGALVWGYGVRAWGFGRSLPRYLTLSLLAGMACTFVAVPILVLVFGGLWGHPAQDILVPALAQIGAGLWGAVTSTNLLLSLTDKLLSGVVALAVAFAILRFGLGSPRGLTFGPFAASRAFDPRVGYARRLDLSSTLVRPKTNKPKSARLTSLTTAKAERSPIEVGQTASKPRSSGDTTRSRP